MRVEYIFEVDPPSKKSLLLHERKMSSCKQHLAQNYRVALKKLIS